MAKKEEHKEQSKETKEPKEVEEEEESEFPEDEFSESQDDEETTGEETEYNKEMMILDETANKLIHKMEGLDPDNKDNWDDLKELSKILKNITSAKKNLLKADLLSIELDDCLYDDLEEDEDKHDDAPIEFEDEEIEEVEEPETKKDSKKHK